MRFKRFSELVSKIFLVQVMATGDRATRSESPDFRALRPQGDQSPGAAQFLLIVTSGGGAQSLSGEAPLAAASPEAAIGGVRLDGQRRAA